MRNIEVVKAWSAGQEARSSTGNLSTDGSNLYSYNLRIGYTDADGSNVVLDYTASGDNFMSMTTSQHVGLGCRYADRVEDPVTSLGSGEL